MLAMQAETVVKRIRYKCPTCDLQLIRAIESKANAILVPAAAKFCEGCHGQMERMPVYREVFTPRGWRKIGVTGDTGLFAVRKRKK